MHTHPHVWKKDGSAEISVGEDEWGQKGPKVQSQSQPTGADLHPHCRHAALHGLGGNVRPVRRKKGRIIIHMCLMHRTHMAFDLGCQNMKTFRYLYIR